jgi:cytochrome P450
MVKDMRTNPQSGLIADLLAVEAEGQQLTEDELVSMIFLLMFAGFETTTHLISGSIIALDQNPDQRAWLFTDFDNRIEPATEELCRFVSSVAGTKPRIAANDTEVDGQLIKKGDKVMALPLAANYDPAVFDQPEILRLDRFPNPHLSFSTGSHFCLGMQLARVELQEALRALYTAHSALGVSKPVIYAKRPGLRGIKHLNVTLF